MLPGMFGREKTGGETVSDRFERFSKKDGGVKRRKIINSKMPNNGVKGHVWVCLWRHFGEKKAKKLF